MHENILSSHRESITQFPILNPSHLFVSFRLNSQRCEHLKTSVGHKSKIYYFYVIFYKNPLITGINSVSESVADSFVCHALVRKESAVPVLFYVPRVALMQHIADRWPVLST